VAIANSGTDGLTGAALRAATVHGLRTAMFVAAAGIALTALAALGFSRAGKPLSTARAVSTDDRMILEESQR
jgi:hypothetical protein